HSEPIKEEQLKQTRDEFWDTAPQNVVSVDVFQAEEGR
ncbi:hypothetical protein Tco_0515814, partial [Tanacetum coccineum]